MSSTHTVSVASNLSTEIRNVFAQVTRYPLEVLDLSSGLEEDLGIDSVKLGEVFAVLREQYNLPEKLDLPREQLRSIGGIAEALQVYLKAATPSTPAPPQEVSSNGNGVPASSTPSNGHSNGLGDRTALLAKMREIFAQVTRYPIDILEPDAALEEDLGIDSVKLGEVFAVIREQYSLPEKLDLPREQLKSIAGITAALHDYLGRFQAASPASNGSSFATVTVLETPAPPIDQTSAQSFAVLTPERKPFAGKVALITGSGRGLGSDIAIYLAQLGASVVVNSFHSRGRGENTVEEIKANGGNAIHAWGSVA